mgnify:CR=1 FL=1|tara:strand:+ start:532 stop:753 length:222 start_codon:yes stop_codon:yes gene_type:complete
MKNFEKVAQSVWATKDVQIKRELLLNAIDEFDHKGSFNENVVKFTRAVNASDAVKLDFIASSLALNNTMKVIK